MNAIDSTNSIDSIVPKPLSPYGASKLSCEGYCSAFYGSYGLKTVISRFSNVYGRYCLHKESVIVKFIKDGISKGELTVYGDGSQSRDFIHVDDLCKAHLDTSIETSILELYSQTKTIEVLTLAERGYKGECSYREGETLKSTLLNGLKIDLKEVF